MVRKKLPDGVDLLDKIPARDKGAKEGDARGPRRSTAELSTRCATGARMVGKGRLVACLNRPAFLEAGRVTVSLPPPPLEVERRGGGPVP